MTTREDELLLRLRSALRDEAEAMDVDTGSAARRLQREIGRRERSRAAASRWLAAAVLVVGAVAGWSAWNAQRDVAPAAPAPQSSTSSRITPIPSTWPYLLDLNTRGQTPLPNRFVPGGPDIGTVYSVLPGTRRVAVSTCPLSFMGCQGPSTARISSLDDTAIQTLRIPPELYTMGIGWSPDGGQLLYGATNGDPYAVGEYYLYDLRTDRSTQITNIALESAYWWSLQSSFTADGRAVLYDLPRDGAQETGWDVWSVPVTGGPSKVFLRDAKAPKAIPGGTSVAYLTPKPSVWGGSAVGIVDDSGSRRVLVETEGVIEWLHVSPDGTRIAYNEDSDGETRTWVVTIATGQKTRVAAGSPGPWLDDHTLIVIP